MTLSGTFLEIQGTFFDFQKRVGRLPPFPVATCLDFIEVDFVISVLANLEYSSITTSKYPPEVKAHLKSTAICSQGSEGNSVILSGLRQFFSVTTWQGKQLWIKSSISLSI